MKKIFILFSFLIMCFSLISCTPPADIVTTKEAEQFESGATNINMWCARFEEWQNQLNQSQRIAFNSNTTDGIQLTQTFIAQTDIDDRLRAARETNTVPDIYMISIGNLYKEVKNGYAIDISSYIDTWDDLIPSALEAVTYNNKHYGYPICVEPSTLLFYRKDLLQKYANTTTVPTTWDGLLELCGTIKSGIKSSGTKGVYAFDVPKGVACAWGTWGMQQAASNGLAINDNWDQSRLLTDGKTGYTNLGNLWASLYGNGYVPLSSGAYNEIIDDLCAGKLVMTTAGSWSVSEIMNTYKDMRDNIGIAVMPTFDGNQNVTTATNGGWVYVISSACKNVDKAIEVIKYLVAGSDTSRMEEYYRLAYYSKAAPRKSVQTKIEEALKTQTEVPVEWVQVINNVSRLAILEPIYDWDISVQIEGFLENCAMGEDVLGSLTEADTEIKNLIIKNKTAGTNPRK